MHYEPEPCMMPGHHCAARVHRTFPAAELRSP
ncbi:hypothetical protein ABT269_21235 [Streptomyces viridosporus]